jgi:hypothetical protein
LVPTWKNVLNANPILAFHLCFPVWSSLLLHGSFYQELTYVYLLCSTLGWLIILAMDSSVDSVCLGEFLVLCSLLYMAVEAWLPSDSMFFFELLKILCSWSWAISIWANILAPVFYMSRCQKLPFHMFFRFSADGCSVMLRCGVSFPCFMVQVPWTNLLLWRLGIFRLLQFLAWT